MKIPEQNKSIWKNLKGYFNVSSRSFQNCFLIVRMKIFKGLKSFFSQNLLKCRHLIVTRKGQKQAVNVLNYSFRTLGLLQMGHFRPFHLCNKTQLVENVHKIRSKLSLTGFGLNCLNSVFNPYLIIPRASWIWISSLKLDLAT